MIQPTQQYCVRRSEERVMKHSSRFPRYPVVLIGRYKDRWIRKGHDEPKSAARSKPKRPKVETKPANKQGKTLTSGNNVVKVATAPLRRSQAGYVIM